MNLKVSPLIGYDFRRYRKYLGINLKTAAKEIGISHTTLADIENGHKDIIKNKKKWKAFLKYVDKIDKKVHQKEY